MSWDFKEPDQAGIPWEELGSRQRISSIVDLPSLPFPETPPDFLSPCHKYPPSWLTSECATGSRGLHQPFFFSRIHPFGDRCHQCLADDNYDQQLWNSRPLRPGRATYHHSFRLLAPHSRPVRLGASHTGEERQGLSSMAGDRGAPPSPQVTPSPVT